MAWLESPVGEIWSRFHHHEKCDRKISVALAGIKEEWWGQGSECSDTTKVVLWSR